jgi:hypothetical protein
MPPGMQYCTSLTEANCGTLNYVFLAGAFRQCGFRKGECLAKHGNLLCPIPPPSPPATPPPPPPPTPPPAAPPPITCETLLAEGTNLVATSGEYCSSRTTEAECGTLNYVPLSGTFKQCGFRFGECLAKYGDLVCPFLSTDG